MIPDTNAPVVRRLARAVALTPAVLLLAAAAPALAAPPDQWPHPQPVHPLHVLLVLVAIPAALYAVITFLVYVPSMARGDKYRPGRAWHAQPEWFGGPRGGVEAADQATPDAIEPGDDERGGASARW